MERRTPKVRTNSSVVWNYFSLHNDPTMEHLVVCVICGKEHKRAGSTSNLLHHIKVHHFNVEPPAIPDSKRVQNVKRHSDGALEKVGSGKKIRTNSSFVWDYFEKPTLPNQSCTCNLCGLAFKYNIGGSDRSTTPLWKHLEKKHPEAYEQAKRRNLERSGCRDDPSFVVTVGATDNMFENEIRGSCDTIVPKSEPMSSVTETTKIPSARDHVGTPGSGKGVSRTLNDKKKEYIDALVLKVITSDLQPCSFVENESFRGLLKAFDPSYHLPSRGKFSTEFLPQVYESVQQDVKLALQLAEKVAITTESWISWSSQQFLTITAHFFTMTWEKKSFVLCTTQISNGMTPVEMAGELKNTFMQWEIQDKVCAIVSDGSALMTDAIHTLGVDHVPCFVHALDRAVKEALKNTDGIAAVANRVRGLITYFQYSNDGVSMLKEIQGTEVSLKMMVKDEEARWMSTLNMFRSYLEQHEVVSAALCLLSKTEDCLTDREVSILKRVVETLEPFELAANELSDEKSATLSTMIPMVKQLQECLSELHYQNFPLTSALVADLNNLSSSLEANFTVGASTVLDPRFKYLPFSNVDNAKNIERRLTSLLSDMFEETSSPDADAPEFTHQAGPSPSRPMKSLWNRFDSKVDDLLKSSSPATTGPTIEMRRYFESVQPRRHEVHPFEWWKLNQTVFPNLTKLAQRFLAIPATSVPAALIFSKDSEVFLAKRSCLEETHIDKMIFLNKNYTKCQILKGQQ